MRTRYYPAVIETDERGGFGIFFPDLPGCVSAGDVDGPSRKKEEKRCLFVRNAQPLER